MRGEETVLLLLHAGADLDYYPDSTGDDQIALKAAVAGGHARLVEILLQEGTNPNGVGHEKRAVLTPSR